MDREAMGAAAISLGLVIAVCALGQILPALCFLSACAATFSEE